MIILFSLLLACGGGETAAQSAVTGQPATASAPAPADPSPKAAGTAGDIDVATLKARMDAGDVFVVDVRTPAEFASGHVPGAVNLPLQELKARVSELEPHKDEDFAVICAVGGRSAVAADYLRSQGYDKVVNVLGGTRAWVQAGFPTEKPAPGASAGAGSGGGAATDDGTTAQ